MAIRRVRDSGGMAIVLVERYFDFAWELADHVIVLDRGRVVVRGRRDDEVDRNEASRAVSLQHGRGDLRRSWPGPA